MQRQRQHQQQLQTQLELQQQQQKILHHLQQQLRLLSREGDDEQPQDRHIQDSSPSRGPFAYLDCSQAASAELRGSPATKQGRKDLHLDQHEKDLEALLLDVQQVLQRLQATENVTTNEASTNYGSSVVEARHEDAPSSSVTVARRPASKFAYVMVACNMSGHFSDTMWGVLAVARMLQRVSSYPVLLLTDADANNFAGRGGFSANLSVLNVHTISAGPLGLPLDHSRFERQRWHTALTALKLWTLTDYKRLIWLESDSVVSRNLDWLFHMPGIWAQREDRDCHLKEPTVGSGVMMVQPDDSTYRELLEYLRGVPELPNSSQRLVSQYFSTKQPGSFSLLSDVDAGFGRCLGRAPTPYLNHDRSEVRGLWNMPAFVHRSGGWQHLGAEAYGNVCFSIDMARQRYTKGNHTINVCHYHPLGAYWRDHFCEAVWQLQIDVREAVAYCTDSCWYLGVAGTTSAHDSQDLCGPLDITISSVT